MGGKNPLPQTLKEKKNLIITVLPAQVLLQIPLTLISKLVFFRGPSWPFSYPTNPTGMISSLMVLTSSTPMIQKSLNIFLKIQTYLIISRTCPPECLISFEFDLSTWISSCSSQICFLLQPLSINGTTIYADTQTGNLEITLHLFLVLTQSTLIKCPSHIFQPLSNPLLKNHSSQLSLQLS